MDSLQGRRRRTRRFKLGAFHVPCTFQVSTVNPLRISLLHVSSLLAVWLTTVAAAQTVNVSLTTPTSTYVAAGGTLTLTATITYSVSPTALGGTIFVPSGWSLASTGGANVPNSAPAVGSTTQLDYAYFSFPASTAQFTIVLNYPAGLTGNQTITSSFQYRSPTQNFTPAAIVLTPTSTLSATQVVPTKSLAVNTAAAIFTPVTASGGTAPYTFAITPSLPAGLALNTSTGAITGTPTTTSGVTTHTVTVTDSAGANATSSFSLTVSAGLVITSQPQATSVLIGGSATLSVSATGIPAPSYQWRKNGAAITAATSASLALSNFQVSDAGAYAVDVSNGAESVRSQSAAVGVLSTAKAAGGATEFRADIVHANGNVYDQVLLTGSSAAITADDTQITRTSFIDLNDDIVQVEFSGPGTLTITLENSTGPAAPLKYNQPDIAYMKGHASIVLTGANENSHLTVFTVGTGTALNQALFPAGMTYDGIADLGLISIATTNGKFGGIRTSNVGYFRAAGLTGIYAPGVAVQGPTFVGDITADADATGVLVFGSTTDARITGGDLLQLNNRAIQVDGITTLAFTAGTKSGGQTLPAQTNRARLERNGVDVTSQLVH
jgi:hypothetical protein